MAARTAMADIITQLRLLVSDPAGSAQMFADDELQDILDANGEDERYEQLAAVESIAPGGVVTYHLYTADDAPWEADAQLMDGLYNVITAGSGYPMLGRWTFASDRRPPVLITGRVYDLNGAAADTWDIKATKYAAGFDFSADGGTYSKSQQYRNAIERGQYFRSQSEGSNGYSVLRRTDVSIW